MKLKSIESIIEGEVMEQNIFRHDSLLAIPKGTIIKSKEKEYLKDLRVREAYSSDFDEDREYDNKETVEVIKDTIYSCTLWDKKFGKKLFNGLNSKLKKQKKVMEVFTKLRRIDHYSFVASVNIAIVVAKIMTIRDRVDKDLVNITFYALIHDIGRIRVSKITTREGKLTELEQQAVRKHPIMSYRLLEKFKFPVSHITFALQTHEKYDGTGYPMGLSKDEIEPLAQIISIAEMYNALSSFRPHRGAFHPIEVLNMIKQDEDRAFSKVFINFFLEKYTPYREGVMVELSTGKEARIMKINKRVPMFPLVMVFDTRTGKEEGELNLFKNQDIRIARVLI